MSHMHTKETFGLCMRHITFLLCNAAEAELKEGIGSTGNVTLLAEKLLWHNGFLTFENAVNSVTEETFIFVLQGDVEV